MKAGHGVVGCYITNLIVGAGGIGCVVQDYLWKFLLDTTVTATADFNFLGLQLDSNKADWGIVIAGRRTLTINVPEGLTVTCGIGINGESEGCIRKTGAGTLVMTDTFDGTSGYLKNFGTQVSLLGSLIVDEGTLKVAVSGQLGGGTVWLAEGTRMEVSPGVTLSNRIDGSGTLRLADGVTLANNGNPWRVAAVEFATAGDAVTVTAPDGTVAPFAFLTGVNAADLSRFTCAAGTLSVKGGALMLADAAAATDYVWVGASGDDWATPASWLVDGATPATAPTSADTIRFENDSPVAVTGTVALAVAKIVTTSGATVTFECPVQFASTYNVQNAAVAPVFAGGATATIPDASLTNANIPSHEFRGNVTLTNDWSVPSVPAGNPFVVAPGANLRGTTITADAYSSANYHLRIDKGATATFDTVDVKAHFVFKLNGGRLVATGAVNMWQNDCGQYLDNNVGTVEANAIIKNDPGHNNINFYVTDMLVGAGGFGMFRRDYNLVFQRNSRLTAKDNLTIHHPWNADGTSDGKDGDWGLNLNGYTFTINTAGYTVNFDSITRPTTGKIVKEGEGELVMQKFLKEHTGGTILNGGLTTVKRTGTLGYCTATVNSGATLRFTDAAVAQAYPIVVNSGATLANEVTVSDTSTLTLAAGAILKPVQNTFFDVSAGTIVLPGFGTVTVDMTDFTFVTGLANPVLVGVGDGDAAKFSALVPEGVEGSFSVSNGILYFTATSGGSTAADLFWHPAGDSIWSTSIAAWTNAAGTQVVFEPFANATVADAATISLPADVDANNVTVSADGDVAINGAGKLSGPGAIMKKGEGTFTFNATGGLDAQPIIVSNGVFKVGEDLVEHALGATGDTSPIVVADGGTFDINYNTTPANDVTRSKVTRDKLVHIAGDGYEGQGAVVNNNLESQRALSTLVLDDDASVGGTARFDVRGGLSSADFARYNASIYGPAKTLTVKNTTTFGIVNSDITLGSLVITNGGIVQIEGSGAYNIADGVHLADGNLIFYSANFGDVPITADSGVNTLCCNSGTPTVNSPITVASGATLTHTGGNTIYAGPISGPFRATGGTSYLKNSANLTDLTFAGAMSGEAVRLRQGGTYTGANIVCSVLGLGDEDNAVIDFIFRNSFIATDNFMVGWGCSTKANASTVSVSIGEGTTVVANKIALADDGTSTSKTIKSVLSVDGGTLNLTNSDFFIAYNGPHADFIVNSGTASVTKATIDLRRNNQALGGYNTARFIQNGGVFNYGGAGFAARYEDNTEDGQIVLKGGEFNASANWSIPHWIPTYFKPGDENGWTLNQANGTTATWNTALLGDGDVTLNGAATLVGNKEVQGAVGGRWTIGEGFTAGLQGAASLLGGLDIGEGASVTVDIATNRCAVFTARDFSAEPTSATCITNRFNRAIGATTRGTITHNETFLFKYYAQGDRPFGNMNYTGAYAVGQFYVEEGKAGVWTFKGKCDDWVLLWIDGELVMASSGRCVEANGTKDLSVGWHSFRHIATDNGGAFGASNGNAYETLGYKDGSGTMSNFARFNVENLKMRPAADFGDPNNPNTVCWSHYKGTSADVKAATYKNDFDWDFRCVTNTLDMLQWKGGSSTYMNYYTVNRFDGWFYVTAENADKPWTFHSQYDDQCALWIDGVDSGLTGANSDTPVYTVTLSKGWHKFRIQTADYTGNAGPWNTGKYALSYKVGTDGTEMQFTDANLRFSMCPDGYVQGDVTLASNATLSNTASGEALVYGNVIATGTGATVSGGFKFEGGTLAFQNVDPGTRDLSTMLAFSNPTADYLANVGAISIDFTAKPTRSKVTVCPAGGLTAETATPKVSVTMNGESVGHYKCFIENGDLKVRLANGFTVFIR